MGYQKSPTSSSNNYKKKVVVGGARSYGGSPALSSNSYKKNNATFGGFGSSRGYVGSKSIGFASGSGGLFLMLAILIEPLSIVFIALPSCQLMSFDQQSHTIALS
ncbi:hypothetical protein Tco_0429558 [Tanacetum coccineum]